MSPQTPERRPALYAERVGEVDPCRESARWCYLCERRLSGMWTLSGRRWFFRCDGCGTDHTIGFGRP